MQFGFEKKLELKGIAGLMKCWLCALWTQPAVVEALLKCMPYKVETQNDDCG